MAIDSSGLQWNNEQPPAIYPNDASSIGRQLIKAVDAGAARAILGGIDLPTDPRPPTTHNHTPGQITPVNQGVFLGRYSAGVGAVEIILIGTEFTVSDGTLRLSPTSPPVPVATVIYSAARATPSGYLRCNGAAISRTTYANLFNALVLRSTVTISIATPGVVTWANHGLGANDPVKFTTTGALPTGLTSNTTYYVVGASVTANTFQVSATAGGAAINTTGTQSGVHTAISAAYGDGDGSTTFNVPDLRGRFVRDLDEGAGRDSNRVLGSYQADEIKSHIHTLTGLGVTRTVNGLEQYISGVEGSLDTAATGGADTRPMNVAMMAFIKF